MLATARLTLQSAWDLGSALAKVPAHGHEAMNQVKHAMNRVFDRAEQAGLAASMPVAFDQTYEAYPELRRIEAHYSTIRRECEAALAERDRIPDISKLGGAYTAGGIHTVRWKALMLKAGKIVPENAKLCPQTAELLADVRSVYTAFFSILEAGTYVSPHWGYFKGFYRYHLGVKIPGDNAQQDCWIRINKTASDAIGRDLTLIEQGEKYHWREGKGVMFDDTRLHDAYNGSSEVRVVLWLDVLRKLPPALAAYRRLCLAGASLEPSLRRLRRNAAIASAATSP